MERIGFAQIQKVDLDANGNVFVHGRMAHEVPDKQKEIFDYAKSKPMFEAWSADVSKVTGGKSLGNVREMHSQVAAGKITAIDFNDAESAIDIVAQIVDKSAKEKVLEGIYTGFSIGGKYVEKWDDPEKSDHKRYSANPSEVSLVDRPCIPSCTFFQLGKADGTTEQVEFKEPPQEDDDQNQQVQKGDVEVDGTDADVAALGQFMTAQKMNVGDVLAIIKADAELKANIQKELETKARELATAAKLDPDGLLVKKVDDKDVEKKNWEWLVEDAATALAKVDDKKVDPPEFTFTAPDGMDDAKKDKLFKVILAQPAEDQEELAKSLGFSVEVNKVSAKCPKCGTEVKLGAAKGEQNGDLAKLLADTTAALAASNALITKMGSAPRQSKAILRVSKGEQVVKQDQKEIVVEPIHEGKDVNEVATAMKKIHASGGLPGTLGLLAHSLSDAN